ncbi:hypothetical protein HN992_00475 [Candidatus Woesearchaeota archaeon]|jgi:hypothetical protein|nr:hypothetical protein [Candidatus Woesearchaeota archaeon]MBT4207600.1 hypothetical protein [Candidatus Woesearchaeota archaeon]MBT6761145.1 hypothetical protein [Candidatus Woesearchaeota archaeon]MBT6940910.1 hypothetical protein [Candidatus Woesearchaeota archaeon]MBT7556529.1 hypothetical protein [Candidatus Woesearchaeota archaeon]
MNFEDFFGWIGMLLVLGAYSLISLGVFVAQSLGYVLMNAVGSLFLLYLALKKKAFPLVFLNGVWILISLISLIRMI